MSATAALTLALALALVAALAASASARTAAAGGAPERTIHFAGKAVRAPASWPVYRLAEHPGICVRLDRRAVYLGAPAANQSCPAEAIGRRRAIVVEGPAARARARAGASAIPAPRRGASTSATGGVFTGLGFDACSAPSSRALAAWAQSPYRAIGVYIGGENRACTQPNLTASWVEAQTAAGWSLIPTYVGSQAPTSSCSSCAKLTASGAASQGAEEATDAVAEAAAVGIGPGSPIYFDMESYSRTTSATNATLAFLEAWTDELHSLGYLSGVYSSSSSGIADLAGRLGSTYHLPDDLWIANWNNQKNTLDPVVPASGWASHQRIHQYQGGHNETYGGTTINIDNNYVDAATATGSATVAGDEPGEDDPIGVVDLAASPTPGYVRVRGWAFDPTTPTSPLSVRVVVGGRAGTPKAGEYELGQIATAPRRDVLAEHPEAGSLHGFDATVPVAESGEKPVCVYALDVEPGEDTLLGCETAKIGVALTLSNLRATPGAVKVRLTCSWPAGMDCPGYLALRTSFKVSTPRRRKPPRVHVVTRPLGRRAFHLAGGRSHGFVVPLTKGARRLLGVRGRLRTQLVASIPGGGRRFGVVGLEQVAARR